ncbi:MAG: Uma2 family endonuclease [Ardenticatenaceae bacterium]
MDLLEERRVPIRLWAPPEEKSISENGLKVSFDTPISQDGLRVSEETYWEKYYHHPDFNYEWVNGRLEEKPMSNLATFYVYRWFLRLLESYLEVNQIAKLTGLEMGFTVPLPPEKEKKRNKKRKNVRKPDLGVVLNSNPVNLDPKDNSYDGIFDLCIEAISYTTKKAEKRDTVEKKEEYEYVRVKEYYLLDDREKETGFYRLDRWGIYKDIEPIDGDIIRSEVLPGFQFRISDLYRQPSTEELVKDVVYQGFVMVKYQAEKERADQLQSQLTLEEQEKQEARKEAEEQRKEKEEALRLAEEQRERAEEERKEKERLIALLKQMGISPD